MPEWKLSDSLDGECAAKKWQPILPLLVQLKEARGVGERMTAARNLTGFIVRKAFGVDPYSRQAFLLLCLVADISKKDIRVRSALERLCRVSSL